MLVGGFLDLGLPLAFLQPTPAIRARCILVQCDVHEIRDVSTRLPSAAHKQERRAINAEQATHETVSTERPRLRSSAALT